MPRAPERMSCTRRRPPRRCLASCSIRSDATRARRSRVSTCSAPEGSVASTRPIGAPGHDPFGPEGANFNLIIGNAAIDPISGSVPHRAYLCQIRRAD